MIQPTQVISILTTLKPHLTGQYHIRRLGLFGSIIKGDISEHSDIDILVEFEEPPSIFGFLDLEEELTDALQNRVDLVDIDGLKPILRPNILAEVQYV